MQLRMRTSAGTPYFMAPEVLNGSYTHKCDIWSLACVLYLLVAGKLPYSGLSREEVFKKIRKGKFQQLDTFSPELKSLLSQMFQLDPENRPTAHEL